MEKQQIIDNLSYHFKIHELVCPHVFEMHGAKSWLFLDEKILFVLMVLRNDIFNAPMKLNNYITNGQFSQRGLRCPYCRLNMDHMQSQDLYLSPHNFGQAFDCDVDGYSAMQARRFIRFHYKKLKYPIRIEKDVNWLHFDTFNNLKNSTIYEF